MKDYNLIASNSSGNSIIIREQIMLDIGIKLKDKNLIEPFMKDIKAIFVTHRHSDHIQLPLMKWILKEYPKIHWFYNEDVKEYLDEKLVRKVKGEVIPFERPNEHIIVENIWYNIGILKFMPLEMLHDVPNHGFYIRFKDDYKVFVGYDTSSMEHIKIPPITDLIIIEHHHEEEHYDKLISEKVLEGEYSHEIGARETHHSFEQAKSFLDRNKIVWAKVVKAHISTDEYYSDVEKEYIYSYQGE